MRVEAHPAAAALDTFVVDRVEAVDHAVGRRRTEHGIEGGEDLRCGSAIAAGQPGEKHCFPTGEEIPGIDPVDPGTTSEQANQERCVAILSQPPNHVVAGAGAGLKRTGQGGNARFQAPALVVPRQQRLGRGLERLISFALQTFPQRTGDRVNHRDRILGLQIVKLDPQPAKPVTATAARKRQAHRAFCNRSIFVADKAGNRSIRSAVHSRRQLLFVRPAKEKGHKTDPFQQSGIP